MLDVFASVGASQFDLTFTDLDGKKRGYRPAQHPDDLRRFFSGNLIASCDVRRINVIVRPRSSSLVQLDDVHGAALGRLKEVAFLILATSPGNHQAWLAIEGSSADFARRLKKGVGADLNASGATRVAGTLNFKRAYAPNFPQVRIEAAEPGRIMRAAHIIRMGLLAPADPIRPPSTPAMRTGRGWWPNYERCLERAPLAHNSEDRRDVSRADFTWCLIAADWGHSASEIATRLLEVSGKARENGERYAALTAERAAAAVWERSR